MNFILSFIKTLASSAVIVPMLKRIAVALGISAVSYVGVSTAVNALTTLLVNAYGGVPADVVAVLAIAKVPNAINVLLSAITASMTIRGLTSSGSIQRVLWRPGTQGTLF